jgi:hypothetical protein
MRLQQDSSVHMSYDEVLGKFEKKPIGKRLGGEFPMNPGIQAILDKYVPVGVILEHLFGMEGASQDPQWAYVRDPFFMQQQQRIDQMKQVEQQQQAQAQQQAQGAAPQQGGSPDQSGGGAAPGPQGEAAKPTQESPPTEHQKTDQQAEASASGPTDLTRSLDQALVMLSKSEAQLPASKRKLLQHQRVMIDDFIKGWNDDLKEVNSEILTMADSLKPKKK